MKYMGAETAAEKWKVSERSVRNYCASGRVPGAFNDGKGWNIPEDADKPERKQRRGKVPRDLLKRLKAEKETHLPGGIYHRIQIDMTYNSNHMEGSRLTHDQTRYIFETHTVRASEAAVNVDDIVETVNHFRCIDLVIDQAGRALSESFIKQLHLVLKSGTFDSRQPWFAVGEYKRLPNTAGMYSTAQPEDVPRAMKKLLSEYDPRKLKTFEEILEFHWGFEKIHPFQDGNGRVGRLIMFKECLRNGIVPFIIDDANKEFYYRGLREWKNERGWLRDTCLAAQDRFQEVMREFGVEYGE